MTIQLSLPKKIFLVILAPIFAILACKLPIPDAQRIENSATMQSINATTQYRIATPTNIPTNTPLPSATAVYTPFQPPTNTPTSTLELILNTDTPTVIPIATNTQQPPYDFCSNLKIRIQEYNFKNGGTGVYADIATLIKNTIDAKYTNPIIREATLGLAGTISAHVEVPGIGPNGSTDIYPAVLLNPDPAQAKAQALDYFTQLDGFDKAVVLDQSDLDAAAATIIQALQMPDAIKMVMQGNYALTPAEVAQLKTDLSTYIKAGPYVYLTPNKGNPVVSIGEYDVLVSTAVDNLIRDTLFGAARCDP